MSVYDLINKQEQSVIEYRGGYKCYLSEERDKCIELCGCEVLTDRNKLERLCQKYELKGENVKSAMTALMHLNFERAASALPNGSSLKHVIKTYRFGVTQENKQLQALCDLLAKQANDPYEFVALTFLSGKNFSEILECEGVSFSDRIAFACRFMADDILKKCLEDKLALGKAKGDLDALLLTGLDNTGSTEIIDAYLDYT